MVLKERFVEMNRLKKIAFKKTLNPVDHFIFWVEPSKSDRNHGTCFRIKPILKK